MKECPYCHKKIAKNARFCLNCMKLLSEKKQISHEFGKISKVTPRSLSEFFRKEILSVRFLILILFFAGTVAGTFFLAPKNNETASKANKPEKEIFSPTETKDTSSSSQRENENISENPIHTSQGETEKDPIPSSSQKEEISDKKENTPPATTTGNPPTNSNTDASANPDNNSNNNANTNLNANPDNGSNDNADTGTNEDKIEDPQTPDPNGVVYTYRAATTADLDYGEEPPENSITITGVKTTSSNFTYEIPKTIDGKRVIAIGNGAFGAYSFLKEHFPDYKNNQDAYRIREITFPEGLLAIGDAAFQGSLYLEGMILPKSLTYIGGGAFQNCYFETVKIQGTSRIAEYSFENCKIGSLSLEEGVKTIAYCAFRNSSISRISFPKSLNLIVTHAFYNALIFQSTLSIPSSTTIESSAFYGCSVTIRRV